MTGLLHPSDLIYPGAPQASKKVDYGHSAFNYPEGTHSFDGASNPVGTLLEEGFLVDNTTATVNFNVTNLTGPDLTKVEGEEVFTISALADFNVSSTILDSEKVQIWPVAEATLSGYDSNEHYDNVPPLTIDLIDLYPSSTTYLRVYPGPPSPDPTNAVTVNSSYVVIEDSIPQDRTLLLTNMDRYFVVEGLHTMELLHETPFGVDIISSGAISVDRTVKVNGSVYSK